MSQEILDFRFRKRRTVPGKFSCSWMHLDHYSVWNCKFTCGIFKCMKGELKHVTGYVVLGLVFASCKQLCLAVVSVFWAGGHLFLAEGTLQMACFWFCSAKCKSSLLKCLWARPASVLALWLLIRKIGLLNKWSAVKTSILESAGQW